MVIDVGSCFSRLLALMPFSYTSITNPGIFFSVMDLLFGLLIRVIQVDETLLYGRVLLYSNQSRCGMFVVSLINKYWETGQETIVGKRGVRMK